MFVSTGCSYTVDNSPEPCFSSPSLTRRRFSGSSCFVPPHILAPLKRPTWEATPPPPLYVTATKAGKDTTKHCFTQINNGVESTISKTDPTGLALSVRPREVLVL